jgi:tRNA-splicing ligase RtcB
MRVPARFYASKELFGEIEEEALMQLVNTTTLPGITKYAIAMPDIHSGYGPPIGGVGAMRFPDGVISPGFVGYDENCGCRLLISDWREDEARPYLEKLATEIQKEVPSGLGKGGQIKLSNKEIDKILEGGVPYLVKKGYGIPEDVENCEEQGRIEESDASAISNHAKDRGKDQLGTLGSGNHFCEVQKVEEIFDEKAAQVFGLFKNQVVIMVHTGSRGLGHQNCTDYLRIVMQVMPKYNISLPDRELACVPFNSPEGQRFFKAMSAACNFAWSNRHMITYNIRIAWKKVFGEQADLHLLYDVAHNIAKIEEHEVDGEMAKLIVHRKGATRAFPSGHSEIPHRYQDIGQPAILPGSMGTASYVLVGIREGKESFYSTAHGSGRVMSRHAAIRRFPGEEVVQKLEKRRIIIKCHNLRGISEEAPEAYKDIEKIVGVIHQGGLSRKIARLVPLAVIKGE